MPNINSMKASKFLKKEDVGEGTICIIQGVSQENVAKDGAEQELKWCLHFTNLDKPMVLNATNLQLLAKFLGSEETDDWEGKKIILYDDPSISFAGKLTGGIRVKQFKAIVKPDDPKPENPKLTGHIDETTTDLEPF